MGLFDDLEKEDLDEAMEELLKPMALIFKAIATKEFAECVAEMYKNMYDALCSRGFTPDQAVDIICRMNLGKQ